MQITRAVGATEQLCPSRVSLTFDQFQDFRIPALGAGRVVGIFGAVVSLCLVKTSCIRRINRLADRVALGPSGKISCPFGEYDGQLFGYAT